MDDPRVTDEMVEAALDKWYPGEDWRKVLEENLDRYRAEMRAALIAVLTRTERAYKAILAVCPDPLAPPET